MIQETTFTRHWIHHISNTYKRGRKKADPALIEKVTKALHLLENLTLTDLKFILKGGTALLLLLDELHRFSIDIDIVIEDSKNNVGIDAIISKVVEKSTVFNRYEEHNRQKSTIPKAHYKVFYMSDMDETENYVLLDVLYGKSHYVEFVEKEVNCNFVDYAEPACLVKMPSVDCILGDKLTAFAPNTTGIPYGKNKELEIIKQLFDISNLFDSMKNIHVVGETFKVIALQELEYRGLDKELTFIDVLEDNINTAWVIGERSSIEDETFRYLHKGIRTIKNYIFSRNFILETAVGSAAKAAYLSLLIRHDIKEVEHFNKSMDLNLLKIKSPEYKRFKSIVKFDPEAYFFWYKCIEIIENLNPKIVTNADLEQKFLKNV